MTSPRPLTLSEVARTPPAPPAVRYGPPSAVVGDHAHSRRLCAVCVERRYRELNPSRARIAPELIADRIRADAGGVWGAVLAFGVGYRHACAIRAGWRGAGRRAAPIAYRAPGWTDGRRNGWASELEAIA